MGEARGRRGCGRDGDVEAVQVSIYIPGDLADKTLFSFFMQFGDAVVPRTRDTLHRVLFVSPSPPSVTPFDRLLGGARVFPLG